MKVSFDFDSTLDRKDVQQFAKELVNDGIEVWIVTSRMSIEYTKANLDQFTINRVDKANHKLFRIADNLGIKREHIHFTNAQFKINFLANQNFLFHLDDDPDELIEILNSKDPCKPINANHFEWEYDCRKLVEIEKYLENPNKP
jgi:hypothetical protein